MSDITDSPSGGTREPGRSDWRAEFAYTAGVQAFVYGFPVHLQRPAPARLGDEQAGPGRRSLRGGQPFLARRAAAGRRPIGTAGSPSTDCLYSFAWVDLRRSR